MRETQGAGSIIWLSHLLVLPGLGTAGCTALCRGWGLGPGFRGESPACAVGFWMRGGPRFSGGERGPMFVQSLTGSGGDKGPPAPWDLPCPAQSGL